MRSRTLIIPGLLVLAACEGVEATSGESRALSTPAVVQTPLDGRTIPKYVEPLPRLSLAGGTINTVPGTGPLTLSMCEFKANALPTGTFAPGAKPETWVWGYIVGEQCPTTTQDTFTGPVIVATRFVPTQVRYINQLGDTASSNLLAYVNSLDQTLHWADPLGNGANECNMSVMPMPGKRMLPSEKCAALYSGPIPAVPHLHGGEVPSWIDGGPTQWFTSNGLRGNNYYSAPGAAINEAIYTYPNTQLAAPLWFHDHTLGATRLNVYAGLAGAYVLTDPTQKLPYKLPGPETIIPLVIQDRMFDTNGQLFFPAGPGNALNPEHPWWVPEFVGDTMLVNGKVWPYLEVEAKRQRFLILEGSNARAYELFLVEEATGAMGPPFWVIATDGGFLDKPVKVDPAAGQKLVMMPGERYEVMVDFGGYPPDTNFLLRNTAPTPYPNGTEPNDLTTGQIMQIRVKAMNGCEPTSCVANGSDSRGGPDGGCHGKPDAACADISWNPAAQGAVLRSGLPWSAKIARLVDPERGVLRDKPDKVRQLTLNEVMAEPVTVDGIEYLGGPLEILVNNTKWSGESSRTYGDFKAIDQNGIVTWFSELPREGETELWEIVNLTMDAHPIHLHLVQFQIANRESFAEHYMHVYDMAFPGGMFMPGFGPPYDYRANRNPASGGKEGGNPNIDPYLSGIVELPKPEEAGWKDTIRAMPGQVTRIAVRWAPTNLPAKLKPQFCHYPFNPATGPGYVWHCHIIDHEDNEMMRPTMVLPNRWLGVWRTLFKGRDY